MPLYEYQCDACGVQFELIRKFSDPPVDVCPTCGAGGVRKLLSSPAFQFKGSGWYVTDYAKKSEDSSSSAKSAAKAAAESKADAKSDGTPDAKSEAKPEAAKDTGKPTGEKSTEKAAPSAAAPAKDK